MTTQTLPSENKKSIGKCRFFSTRYFRFLLRTTWPMLVALTVVFAISFVVPAAYFASTSFELRYDGYYAADAGFRENMVREISEFLAGLGMTNIVVAMLAAFVCGLVTMRYVNNKTAVNFYHSLPVRREALYVTSTLATGLYFVIPYVVNAFLAYVILALRRPVSPEHFTIVCQAVFLGLLFSLLVYSMTAFAASFCGTGLFRIIGTVYVAFLPAVMFLLTLGMANTVNHNSILNFDYYIDHFILKICPVLRVIETINDGSNYLFVISARTVLAVAFWIVLFFVLSFVLYLVRRSESAGTPLIYRTARFIFKYASLYVGTTAFGLLFESMFDSEFWTVVGCLIGLIVTFMLVNGLMNKSARAIFRGFGGLLIFVAVFVLIFVVLFADVFGMYRNIPSEKIVNYVELTVSNDYAVRFEGDEAKHVAAMLEEALKRDRDGEEGSEKGHERMGSPAFVDDKTEYDKFYAQQFNEYYYEFDKNDYMTDTDVDYSADRAVPEDVCIEEAIGLSDFCMRSYRSVTLNMLFRTRLGFPVAMQYYYDCDAISDVLMYFENSGKTERAPADGEIVCASVNLPITAGGYSEYYSYLNGDLLTEAVGKDKLAALKTLTLDMDKYESSPVIGTVQIHENENTVSAAGYNVFSTYPVYADNTEVLNAFLAYKGRAFKDASEVYADVAANIGCIVVTDNDTGAYVCYMTDANQKEIVKSLTDLCGMWDGVGGVLPCRTDHRYTVTVFEVDDVYGQHETGFREGAVPAFVLEDLAK